MRGLALLRCSTYPEHCSADNIVDQVLDNFKGRVDADLAILHAKLLIATYELRTYCRLHERPSVSLEAGVKMFKRMVKDVKVRRRRFFNKGRIKFRLPRPASTVPLGFELLVPRIRRRALDVWCINFSCVYKPQMIVSYMVWNGAKKRSSIPALPPDSHTHLFGCYGVLPR